MTDLLPPGSYDYPLVALSVLVAVFTAYTAADIIWRVSIGDTDKTRAHGCWVGGMVLGMGVWAAPLVGMLSAEEHFSFAYKFRHHGLISSPGAYG